MSAKKTAVISGGGSKGAFTVGLIARLGNNGEDYQTVIGVSTGALMAPLVALRDYDKLINAYTSVTQKSIFNFNPFNKKGHISITKLIWRLVILNRQTLGESKNLLKLIYQFFTEANFEELEKGRREVIAGVYNKNLQRMEYKSTQDEGMSYQDMVEWIWASANAFPAMSILTKNGHQYEDGGTAELIPICRAVEMGCKDIDVYVHRSREQIWNPEPKGHVKNFRHNLMRKIDDLRLEIERGDIREGLKSAEVAGCKVRIMYLPSPLTNNALMFNQAEMQEWANMGNTWAGIILEGKGSSIYSLVCEEYDFTK